MHRPVCALLATSRESCGSSPRAVAEGVIREGAQGSRAELCPERSREEKACSFASKARALCSPSRGEARAGCLCCAVRCLGHPGTGVCDQAWGGMSQSPLLPRGSGAGRLALSFRCPLRSRSAGGSVGGGVMTLPHGFPRGQALWSHMAVTWPDSQAFPQL